MPGPAAALGDGVGLPARGAQAVAETRGRDAASGREASAASGPRAVAPASPTSEQHTGIIMLALPGPPRTPSASRCSCLLTQLLAHSHIRVMSIARCTNIPSWRMSASWPPPCAATSAAGCRCWLHTPRTVQQKQTARSGAATRGQAAQRPRRRLWQQQAARLQCLTWQLRRPGLTTGASWRRRWTSPGCGGLTPSRLPPTARCALILHCSTRNHSWPQPPLGCRAALLLSVA